MKAPRYLGEIYEQGLGVKQDYKKAAEFYALGAKRDDLASQYRLGKLYEQGLGVAQSYQKAMSLYLKANGRFDHVTAPAFSAIGDLYANGLGVEKNQKEAQIWYEKAAKSLENDKQSR
jgi:mrr restriction system protein (ecoKMrr)|nr:tetratricopeptide repeat protein [uncultured Campylobacter sp.]